MGNACSSFVDMLWQTEGAEARAVRHTALGWCVEFDTGSCTSQTPTSSRTEPGHRPLGTDGAQS